jgi:hypothetical protein
MVSLPRTPHVVTLIQWYAIVAPPLAWTVQLVLGYGFALAACGHGGVSGGIGLHLWQGAAAAVAAIVAAGAWGGAIMLHAATGRGEVDDPVGRVRFMSTVGIVIGLIFLTLIGFTAAGTLSVHGCRT